MPKAAPLLLHQCRVQLDWIDYNGHMNVAYYLLVFDQAVDALLNYIGLDQDHRKRYDCSIFTLEAHISYLQELQLDDPLNCTLQLLDHDSKRMHIFLRMHQTSDDYIAATCEFMLLHMDMAQRRSAAMRPEPLAALAPLWREHQQLEPPPQAGSVIGIRRKPA